MNPVIFRQGLALVLIGQFMLLLLKLGQWGLPATWSWWWVWSPILVVIAMVVATFAIAAVMDWGTKVRRSLRRRRQFKDSLKNHDWG